MWIVRLVKAALSIRQEHKQPGATNFSMSRSKVTNWQENHGSWGHLTGRRSLCNSLQVILTLHKLRSQSWHEVRLLEGGSSRSRQTCLRCSGIGNKVKVSCIQAVLTSSFLLSFRYRWSDFLHLHTAVRVTSRSNTHRWGIFPPVMSDSWHFQASALCF